MINIELLKLELEQKLQYQEIGNKCYFLKSCSSTNDIALNLAKQGEKSGTIVISLRQYNGKGRLGRKWITYEGGLALSIILKTKFLINNIYRIVFIVSNAIIECLSDFNIQTKLKWPNDIYVLYTNNFAKNKNYAFYKKIAGILIELYNLKSQIQTIIIGIGLNIKKPKCNSIINYSNNIGFIEDFNNILKLEEFLLVLLIKLDQKLKKIENNNFFLLELNKAKKKCLTLGNRVYVKYNGNLVSGVAIDIDNNGYLKVLKKDGQMINIYTNDI